LRLDKAMKLSKTAVVLPCLQRSNAVGGTD
jgi:hypothetical protein